MAGPFLFDRVKETTTTTGTGTVTLAGAVTGYQSFAAVGNGNTTYYCIAHQTLTEWEVGIGTYTASGTTLARTTVISSSNSGSLVTFSAGTKDVFITLPASRIYAGAWSSLNQISANNAATPLTKFDLIADQVTTWNPATNEVHIHNSPGTITNDVGLTGPAANGRDQAGAFSASSWIHFYWIWNGTTLASISSTVAPMTGPTLPATYTEWAYACAVRFDGSSHLLNVVVTGNLALYIYDDGGANRIISAAGQQSTFATVNISSLIPPNTRKFIGDWALVFVNTASSGACFYSVNYRPTGSGLTTGIPQIIGTNATNVGNNAFRGHTTMVTDSSQQIDWINGAPGGTPVSSATYLDVVGYYLDNKG